MRAYFSDEDTILAYDDPKADPSYHELYNIYEPRKTVIMDELKRARKRLYDIMGDISAMRDRLALTVPYADLELATELSSIPLRAERETLERLIAMNQSILRLVDGTYRADAVRAIPMSDFIQFRHRWAKCPFHADSKPSFYYYPAQNRAHCFSGCGQKNVIQVYAHLNGLNNATAFKQLSERLV